MPDLLPHGSCDGDVVAEFDLQQRQAGAADAIEMLDLVHFLDAPLQHVGDQRFDAFGRGTGQPRDDVRQPPRQHGLFLTGEGR